MQTLHLQFRALRAISSGQSPSRWPTPSLRGASTWKDAPLLPNHPKPTSAVGPHPKTSRQQFDRCPSAGAGLPLASPFREPRVVGPAGATTRQVCLRQTAENNPRPAAHHKAGQGVGCSLQAPFSEVRWTPSNGLPFLLQPRLCRRASEEKAAYLTANDGALVVVSRITHWQHLRLCSVGR